MPPGCWGSPPLLLLLLFSARGGGVEVIARRRRCPIDADAFASAILLVDAAGHGTHERRALP